MEKVRSAPKVMDLVHDVWAGRKRLIEIDHPELAMVQDIAVQAGQGVNADRAAERLGRSDAGIILWRKILAREMAALAEGRPGKQWRTPPADVLPIIGV
jgi:pilus assembly protein TadC